MAQPVRVRRLTEQEGQKLQQIVRRGSTNSVRFRRAMMLLASGGGSTAPVIARLVQADEDTVRDVIHRFNEIGLACLQPATRRTFAFDEFGPLGIRPTAGSCCAQENRPDRLPATYRRTHGITYVHGCYSVGDDQLWGVNRRRKGIDHTWAAMRTIRAARPDSAPIYVILDNLSAHTNWRMKRWAARNKVELCFTPTYVAWANPIEAHFGPLRQFTLANSRHPNHTAQTRVLQAYLRWRNQNARHPDVLAAQRRERARTRSEKGIRWGGRPLAADAVGAKVRSAA